MITRRQLWDLNEVLWCSMLTRVAFIYLFSFCTWIISVFGFETDEENKTQDSNKRKKLTILEKYMGVDFLYVNFEFTTYMALFCNFCVHFALAFFSFLFKIKY
jgi:hypothetical protein